MQNPIVTGQKSAQPITKSPVAFSKEALALLAGQGVVRANALEDASHAMYFR